jgi:hypothetical protein
VRKSKADHVKVGNTPDGGLMCWCEHCGAKAQVPLPMPVTGRDGFVAWQRRWTKPHAACPRPVNLYSTPPEVVEADVRRRLKETPPPGVERTTEVGLGVGRPEEGGDSDARP